MRLVTERRKELRVHREVFLTYRSNVVGFRRSLALDISPGGAQILTWEDEEPGPEIKLTLQLEPDCNLTVIGRRVWQEPAEDGAGRRVGLSFSSTGLGGSAFLQAWVNRNIA